MKIRRIATGHNPEGKATVATDTMIEGTTVALAPGVEIHRLWGGEEPPTFPDAGSVPFFPDYFPPVGGFRFGMIGLMPDHEITPTNIDPDAAMAEMEEKLPGLAVHLEPDNPGMHTSDTIDFNYIVSGEVWLELDDGEEIRLRAGDTVVQNGTRHAWRNKGSIPCQMLFCLFGAKRSKQAKQE